MLKRLCPSVVFLAALVAGAAYADNTLPASLQWPLGCSVGRECFIQAYPDITAGATPEKPVDYRCGHRSLPGLTGTKVIWRDWQMTLDDQPVYPLAPGQVVEVENTLPDGKIQHTDKACGNHLVLDHGGWQSRYCHLKQSSVRVKVGQRVQARDVLAFVGQSGATTEPVFAFYISKDGQPFDPFLAGVPGNAARCNAQAGAGVWASEVHYLEAAALCAGFAPRIVNHLEAKANGPQLARGLTSASPYLVSWLRIQNVMAGDEELFTLTAPDGQTLVRRQTKLPGDSDDYLSYVVAKAAHAPLAKGDWRSHYELRRAGRLILQKNHQMQLE